MSRIRIFTGHFGSGKTEIAINFAKRLAAKGKKIAVVDIDIVNPYFCIRDIKSELEKEGIRVISANPHFSNAELMVVPAEVLTIFNDKSYEVVIDIGGDDRGAVVLGQYNRYLLEEGYDMYFVVNNNRPFTANAKDTEEYIKAIEKTSRLRVSYLISNSNMSYETEVEHIINGDKETLELSQRLGIPYKYTVCTECLEDSVQGRVHGKVFPIEIYMKPPWS